jgi:zinc/manganese transport system ATP-binding protein/zinc transport system ATP-binding protein
MIGEPALLLLDEPTSGVDLKTRDDILHLLADLNREGMTIVLTTHELNTVAAHLPWVVCVNRYVIAEGDPDEIFTAEILGRTYGAELRVVRQDGVVLVADAAPHRLREAIRHRHEGFEHAHHEHADAAHEHAPSGAAGRPPR